ncbi:MAG TPA: hypothetical protein VM689_03140 [Aliidongia sp.]|nr:hypothetical protein [Aliidongia sp.]
MLAKLRWAQWQEWVAPAQVAFGIAVLAAAIAEVPNGESVISAPAAAAAMCPNAPIEQSALAAFATHLSLGEDQQKSWQDLVIALGRVCVPALPAEASLDDKLANAEAVSSAQLAALRRARHAIAELRPQLTPEQRSVIDRLPVGTGL